MAYFSSSKYCSDVGDCEDEEEEELFRDCNTIFYCAPCDRYFEDANSVRIHLASKRHAKPFIFCSKCESGFVSAAGLIKHVEMSSCYGELSNKQIVEAVRHWEQRTGNPNIFTVPRIGWDNTYEKIISSRMRATEASFDGKSYVCPVCGKGFQTLTSLNQHLNSNVHETSEFHCRKCLRKFKGCSILCAIDKPNQSKGSYVVGSPVCSCQPYCLQH